MICQHWGGLIGLSLPTAFILYEVDDASVSTAFVRKMDDNPIKRILFFNTLLPSGELPGPSFLKWRQISRIWEYFETRGLELGDEDFDIDEEKVSQRPKERITLRSITMSSINRASTFLDILRSSSMTDISNQTGAYSLVIRMRRIETIMFQLSPLLSSKLTKVE